MREAIMEIQSGIFKHVLVIGAEKMSTLSTFGVTKVLAEAGNYKREANIGMTFPAVFGHATPYVQIWNYTRTDCIYGRQKSYI
jgi:acetyl-CoA C-acetyltransferase